MSVQVTGRSWSGPTRALAVLAVLAGVFAMHGLTGNHDAAMAGPHLGAASSAAGPAADHRMGPVDEMGSSSPARPMGGLGDKADISSAATHVAFIPAGDEHPMAGACIAVLTGLVLLLTLLLGLRSLLAWRPVQLTASALHLLLTERSPPWLVPSLSKLCVLRT